MPIKNYDFAIIGAGAAGLHLALAMRDDPFFESKKILILEKTAKNQNDRTWCFWEKGIGKWDNMLRQSWPVGDFFYQDQAIQLNLAPYRYKMLRGLDFYEYAKHQISESPNMSWQNDEITEVKTGELMQITGKNGHYEAKMVFDSRIPEAFFQKDKYTRLLQHFKGWIIRTPEDQFDTNRFTIMDFRQLWQNSTSFTYVLPLNAREAMVEFTLFTPDLIADGDYDFMLRKYLTEILKLDAYEILEQEKGVIPMSDFPFEKFSTDQHIRIGTAGGWVKPSSGYTFRNCEKNSLKLIKNLKAGRNPNYNLISKKFRLYDSILLGVLNKKNELGPGIFHTMYAKNDVKKMFAFLDDETNFLEDFKIINGFEKIPFLTSLFNFAVR